MGKEIAKIPEGRKVTQGEKMSVLQSGIAWQEFWWRNSISSLFQRKEGAGIHSDVAAMQGAIDIPALPGPMRVALAALPLLPLQIALQRTIVGIANDKPSILERLSGYEGKTFLIDPTDLPVVFCLELHKPHPVVILLRRGSAITWDARIAAPFWSHIAMIHGSLDADALFFSGDLTIEGDVEAALALRNALDDAVIDLFRDALAALAPPIGPLPELGRNAVGMLSRLTNLPLTRTS